MSTSLKICELLSLHRFTLIIKLATFVPGDGSYDCVLDNVRDATFDSGTNFT